jgi:anti-anti-sigma factor
MLVVDYEVMDREDDHASLVLRGELAGDVPSEHLKEELERHYVDDGVSEIRVDLDGLTSITLEGVAILLELWRESKKRGKHFVIHDARGQVLEKLTVTGVLRTLEG